MRGVETIIPSLVCCDQFSTLFTYKMKTQRLVYQNVIRRTGQLPFSICKDSVFVNMHKAKCASSSEKVCSLLIVFCCFIDYTFFSFASVDVGCEPHQLAPLVRRDRCTNSPKRVWLVWNKRPAMSLRLFAGRLHGRFTVLVVSLAPASRSRPMRQVWPRPRLL